MVVSFFGHSDYSVDENHIQIVLSALKKPLENGKIDFYLGGYGNFDRFAISFCNKCKKSGYSVKRYFITPYIGSFIENRKETLFNYDGVIYPPLENTPPRYAINKRNEWIIDKSDLIFFFVVRNYGGAYNALKYAKRKNKRYIILADKK